MKRELELYFHIPFCVQKCHYCDFLSAPADDLTKGKYMEALLTETVGSAKAYQEYTVTTVFIGGGTPSAVDAAYVEGLMAAVREHYHVSEDAEISIEVNPGTADGEKLRRYRKAGINRLSIGMQSADNEELKRIGRIHTWEQFADTFAGARAAGFDNINVDVMSALPGQSLTSYRETLRKVLSLANPPEHISAYSLILEEGTRLYEMYERGGTTLPDEDEDREMYCNTKELLEEAGYHRYEISNYAKPGKECRHNVGYWKRIDYVGFGIGAASLVNNVRFKNTDDIVAYMAHPLECREDVWQLSVREQMEEFMFLGLRMTAGVDCDAFEANFGIPLTEIYGDVIEKNIRDGLLRLSEEKEEAAVHTRKNPSVCEKKKQIALTEKGLDVSNYVMVQFLP